MRCGNVLVGSLFFRVAVTMSTATALGQPEVELLPPSSLGTEAATLVGRIQPGGLPTRYYFEYGPTEALGSRTDEVPLPGKLAAFYKESWNDSLGGWKGGMSGNDLALARDESTGDSFVRYSEPSGHDPNHIDGIGWLHLCKYHYPGALGQSYWGGGVPDLRDARIKLKVRGRDWVPNGAELLWWTQADNILSEQFTVNWRRANWAYTGFTLSDRLRSGAWEDIDYRLWNNPHQWTYAGNNLAQKRPNYAYAPIQQGLADLNTDFFHLLAYVDPAKVPTGAIDFDEFEVAYRNHSLVFPSNGGHLIEAPTGSNDDVARLTDGWRNGLGHEWASAAKPAGPFEFVWKFDRPVTINTVQIHQHSEWPSRDVELLVSSDGTNWTRGWGAPIPASSPNGLNFAFALARGLSLPATHAKLRILTGYKPEHWGLGEVELFGTGSVEATDDDDYYVNADLSGLKPGSITFHRLVAVSDAGTTATPVAKVRVPSDREPLAATLAADEIEPTAARLVGRTNSQGERTTVWFEYGTTKELGQRTADEPAGLQETPRTAFFRLGNLTPATEYFYRVVAENAVDKTAGAIETFRTAAAKPE